VVVVAVVIATILQLLLYYSYKYLLASCLALALACERQAGFFSFDMLHGRCDPTRGMHDGLPCMMTFAYDDIGVRLTFGMRAWRACLGFEASLACMFGLLRRMNCWCAF
jgi:hypothetical protein